MKDIFALPKPLVLKTDEDEIFTKFLAIVKVYQLYYQLYKVDVIEDNVKDTIFISINATIQKDPVIYHWYEFIVSEVPNVLENLYQFNNSAESDYEIEELHNMVPRTMIEAIWDDLENWKGDQDVFTELIEMGSNISYIGILIELLESAFEEDKAIGIFPVGLIPLEKKLDSAYNLFMSETSPEKTSKVKTLVLDTSSFDVIKKDKDCDKEDDDKEEEKEEENNASKEEDNDEDDSNNDDETLKSLKSLERIRSLEGTSGIYRIKCFK